MVFFNKFYSILESLKLEGHMQQTIKPSPVDEQITREETDTFQAEEYYACPLFVFIQKITTLA